MSMAGFSSDVQGPLTRLIQVLSNKTRENLVEKYELVKCASWVRKFGYRKVCLQLPDELLVDTAVIANYLKNNTSADIFILADTSYSSCCVDSVAAEHVTGDAVIHFGHACLSPYSHLPVLYIFQAEPLDIDGFFDKVSPFTLQSGRSLIFYDTCFHHALPALCDKYRNNDNVHICPLLEASDNMRDDKVVFGRVLDHCDDVERAIFIGADSLAFTNLIILYPDWKWYTYDGKELQKFDFEASRFLRKRMHLVEKVKDAKAVGILVGTLSVDGSLQAVYTIQTLCKSAGKKSYLVAVGKPNVAKLANFPEIDVFALVSCCQNTLLVDSSDFYKPIVSLIEVELAFGKRPWPHVYSLDFRQLQIGGRLFSNDVIKNNQEETSVSLISGRSLVVSKDEVTEERDQTVMTKTSGDLVQNHGMQYFSQRSWQGLEQNLGQTAVEKVHQGRDGIPTSYREEGEIELGTRKLKVLCLHGYRQDGDKLRQQTGALRKILKNLVEFEFLSAPFQVPNEGECSRSWWFTKTNPNSYSSRDDPETCQLEPSIELVEKTWTDRGPFDGILGFSQGACLLTILAAMSRTKNISLAPRFVVFFSGFKSLCKAHGKYYSERIDIPSLHVFGETDAVIPWQWSHELAGTFQNACVIKHSGGHFVPGTTALKNDYANFFKKFM